MSTNESFFAALVVLVVLGAAPWWAVALPLATTFGVWLFHTTLHALEYARVKRAIRDLEKTTPEENE